jgi:hypothetical protein
LALVLFLLQAASARSGISQDGFGAPWPAVQVLTALMDEQVHHGAEIGVLRDLYRCRQGGT